MTLEKPSPETSAFTNIVISAVEAIKANKKDLAISLLKDASEIDMESPELFNLLGILYEQEGDNVKASKFYRVAYYMDQSYKAAGLNLDRVNNLYYKGFYNVEWGLERLGLSIGDK